MKKEIIESTRITQTVNDGHYFTVYLNLIWIVVANNTFKMDTYGDGDISRYSSNISSSSIKREESLCARRQLSELFQFNRNRRIILSSVDVQVSLITSYLVQQEFRELVLRPTNGHTQKNVMSLGKKFIIFTKMIATQRLGTISKHLQAFYNPQRNHLVILSGFLNIASVEEYDLTTGSPGIA